MPYQVWLPCPVGRGAARDSLKLPIVTTSSSCLLALRFVFFHIRHICRGQPLTGFPPLMPACLLLNPLYIGACVACTPVSTRRWRVPYCGGYSVSAARYVWLRTRLLRAYCAVKPVCFGAIIQFCICDPRRPSYAGLRGCGLVESA